MSVFTEIYFLLKAIFVVLLLLGLFYNDSDILQIKRKRQDENL